MKYNEFTKEEIELNYDLIKKIEMHARNYETEPDKKNFLRSVCAYEQKYILMNSNRPYEVLKYLDELDLKSSRLILDELNYIEIKKLLNLFTDEDKEDFYNTFSDLSLVNQFITKDKNATEHLKELPVARKVDILNSSNTDTIEATTVVYESIPPKAREKVADSLTNVEAVTALNQTSTYKEDKVVNEIKESHTNEVINEKQMSELTNEEIKNELEKEFEEKLNDQHLKELRDDEINKIKREFFMEKLQNYMETMPEFKDLDLNDENLFDHLPPELLSIVEDDFSNQQGIKEKIENANREAENKYYKTKNNIEMLKDSNLKDFIMYMNTVAIFNSLCDKDSNKLNDFKSKCPQLYEEFSQYFDKPGIFNDLDLSKQKEIIEKLQSNSIVFNELNQGIEQIKTSLDNVIRTKLELEKASIFDDLMKNNPNILQELNIKDFDNYSALQEDEKLRVTNYFSKDIEVAKKLKTYSDELEKEYNLESSCVKDGVKFSDLILAVSDKEKFKSYLAKSLVDDNLTIDNKGNLVVDSRNEKEVEKEIDYEKYSVIGNGERRVNLVKNTKILKEFEDCKQQCENEEISKLLNQEEKIEENAKTL